MLATEQLEIILTQVRHMSKTRSIGHKSGSKPNKGQNSGPRLLITTAILIKAALGTPGVPMDARTEKIAIKPKDTGSRGIPAACARNTTAMASNKVVPVLLMLAPVGNTKLAIRVEIPTRRSQQAMVIGRVAELLAVPKATIMASEIALYTARKGVLARTRRRNGYRKKV